MNCPSGVRRYMSGAPVMMSWGIFSRNRGLSGFEGFGELPLRQAIALEGARHDGLVHARLAEAKLDLRSGESGKQHPGKRL